GSVAAAKRAQAGGEKGEPRGPSDLLEAESARRLKITWYPEHVEPPDRIGQKARGDNRPRLTVGQQFEPPRCPLRGGANGITVAAARDVLPFLGAHPRVLIGKTVDREPQDQPANAEQPGEEKRRPPPVTDRERGDERRRERAADRGARV